MLTFEHSGMYNGVFAMRDGTSGSHWSPITGRALDGPYKGRTLRTLPSFVLTWERWRDIHPETTVVRPLPAFADSYHGFDLLTLPRHGEMMLGTLQAPLDPRLPPFENVIGVQWGNFTRAYPLATLSAPRVVEDCMGTMPIVIFYSSASHTAAAFRRTMRRVNMRFRAAESEDRFVDTVSHTEWSLTGEALRGTLAGDRLLPVDFINTRWYGWAAAYPHTEIFFHPRPHNHVDYADPPGWQEITLPLLGIMALLGLLLSFRYLRRNRSIKPALETSR